jgi:hypothetical protein
LTQARRACDVFDERAAKKNQNTGIKRMQRRPREPYKWGKGTEKLIEKLKTREFRAIDKKVRNLITDFAAFNVLGGAGRPRYIPFEECGYSFVLEWDYSDDIWVLNVVSPPKPKKDRKDGESGGGAPEPTKRALPERAKRGRRKFLKRNLLVLYINLKRYRLGQKLSVFVSDSGVMRDLSGIVALWGRLTKPRRRFDLVAVVAEALRPFAESLEQAAVESVSLAPRWYQAGPRLVLIAAASAAQASRWGTSGAYIESEQLRI